MTTSTYTAISTTLTDVTLDHEAAPRVLPNHGPSHGYRIHRVVVNCWHLVKRRGEWWVQRRTLLPVDGSAAPRRLLSDGLVGVLGERTRTAGNRAQ